MGLLTVVWVAAPGLVCGLLLLTVGRPRSEQGWAGERLLLPGAAALGYLVGHAGSFGLAWVPHDAPHWMPHLVLLGALLAVLAELGQKRRPLRWGSALALAGLAAWLPLSPLLPRLPPGLSLVAVGGAAAALVACVLLLRAGLRDATPAAAGAVLCVMGLSVAAACGASGTIVVGQLGAMAAAAFAGLAAVGLLHRHTADMRSVAPVAGVMLWAPPLLAFVYAEMRTAVLCIVAAIPLAFALARRCSARRRSAVQLAVVMGLGGLAVWLALGVSDEAPASPGTPPAAEDDYGYGYDEGG